MNDSDRRIVGWCIARVLLVTLLAVVLGVWVHDASAQNRVFADGFEQPGGGGDDLPIDHCLDPLVYPAGWPITVKTWKQAFSAWDGNPVAVYPYGVSFPVAVGAQRGGITTVAFTPTPNQIVISYHDQVQARPQDGYFRSRPAESMLRGISPCGADVRPPTYGAADPFARPQCRMIENSGSLIFTTIPGYSEACTLVAGRTYVMTIAAVDTRDGLQFGEHTCHDVPSTAQGCDVGIVFGGSSGKEELERLLMLKAFGLPPER